MCQLVAFTCTSRIISLTSLSHFGCSGPATVIIQGIGIGMISCVAPVVILVATIFGCNALAGGYGIALSAVGMLSTLGVTLATDAYGPIADNGKFVVARVMKFDAVPFDFDD